MSEKKISPIVKAAAGLAGVGRQELAAKLGINAQSLTNKYVRDSFSAADLMKVASACNFKLAFVDETGKSVINFPVIINTPPE